MANLPELDVLVMRCKSPEDCDRLIRNAQENGEAKLSTACQVSRTGSMSGWQHP